mmetsp:Transcript_14721/g.27686  ORF Transcript_14721/g.27686 Transcript_14721/m.27686 type:complete len:296 (-) Transcript_14721:35-922(-)
MFFLPRIFKGFSHAKQPFAVASIITPPFNSLKGQNRQVQNTSHRSAAETVFSESTVVVGQKSNPDYIQRFSTTAEVLVSKIFPAGFGWQYGSTVAQEMFQFSPDSVSFALTTGTGDAFGVFLGHVGFYTLKKTIKGDSNIDLDKERDTGILLASAAFCSGSLWQPLVNLLQASDLSFQTVLAGTWIGCGTAFYLGLRGGRTFLPRVLPSIEEPTYENSKNDASLSMAIGGATGFFVGTDVTYLPHQNFLIDVVGIHEGTSTLTGCAIAGTSTSLGFGAAQTVFNIAYPRGKCWND